MPRYFDTFRSHQPRFQKHTEVLLRNQSESDAGLLPLSESKGAAVGQWFGLPAGSEPNRTSCRLWFSVGWFGWTECFLKML